MFAWHPTPAKFEPRVGGRVVWDPDGHVADMAGGEVTEWDPPRLLGYTWAKEGDRPITCAGSSAPTTTAAS